MANLFELVKGIPAHEAAERNGVYLEKNGSMYKACCPIHGEKTPSCCFYPNGSWYCFGCHRGGDSVTLYMELFNLDHYEAAVRLAGDFGIAIPDKQEQAPPPKPKANAFHLEQLLDRYKSDQWKKYTNILHRANEALEKYGPDTMETAWDTQEFIGALMARMHASEQLDWLQQATFVDLAREYKEVIHAGR